MNGLRPLAAALSAALWLLAGCPSPERASAPPAGEIMDPGVVHVHGLGINPADGVLYVATHTGLFRIVDGDAERIGEGYRDIMGFTVAGLDRFLASGHPGVERDLPPLLGLMESTDAGATWEPLSLLGEADFHALRLARGRIHGYDSSGGRLMVSEDGRQWEVRSEVVLVDFVVSPEDRAAVLATTDRGLVASEDGGRTWADPMPDAPPLLYLAWPREEAVWALGLEGEVFRSDDRGRTWISRGSVGGSPEALLAEGETLYAAAHGAGILRSGDGGRTWETLYREA